MEKKEYRKPEMKVMEFTVNENIAATTCNLRAQIGQGICAYDSGMGDVLFAEGQDNCAEIADDSYCYYTVANILFGS